MNQNPPQGFRIVEGGPQQDPDSGAPALLVRDVDDGTYAFFYPHMNTFGNRVRATEIGKTLEHKANSN